MHSVVQQLAHELENSREHRVVTLRKRLHALLQDAHVAWVEPVEKLLELPHRREPTNNSSQNMEQLQHVNSELARQRFILHL